jgi:hypothetical protein
VPQVLHPLLVAGANELTDGVAQQLGAATRRYVVTGTRRTCCTIVVTGRMTVVGQPVQGSQVRQQRNVVTGTLTHSVRKQVCGTYWQVWVAQGLQAGAHAGAQQLLLPRQPENQPPNSGR